MNILEVMHIPLQFKPRGNMRSLHPTPMPLWSLIKGVTESRALAELTASGRRLLAEKGKGEFQEWKPKNLMAVYLSVRFRDPCGRPDSENVGGYTGLAGFDFDGVDPAGTLALLRDVPQVVCAAVSASGRGVWCAALAECGTEAEYVACFAAGVAAFTAAGLSGVDLGAHDPTRARFAASSPEAWWRWDADEIPSFRPDGDISLLRSAKRAKARRAVSLPAGYHMSPELAFDEARKVLAAADETPDGERNTEKARELGVLKGLAAKAGVPPETYAQPFIEKWDAVGSNPKKTRSMVNRLLRGRKR